MIFSKIVLQEFLSYLFENCNDYCINRILSPLELYLRLAIRTSAQFESYSYILFLEGISIKLKVYDFKRIFSFCTDIFVLPLWGSSILFTLVCSCFAAEKFKDQGVTESSTKMQLYECLFIYTHTHTQGNYILLVIVFTFNSMMRIPNLINLWCHF